MTATGSPACRSQPIASLGAAAAPCDPGCPADGSVLQQVHNALGLITYVAGAVAFFLLSFDRHLANSGKWCLRAAAIAWLGLFVFMLVPGLSPIRGLLQRGADVVLWVVVVLVAWRLLGPAGPDSPRRRPRR